MKIGDNVVLKKDCNLSISLGKIAFNIAGGTNGIVLQVDNFPDVEGYIPVVKVGFDITETISITALIDKDSLELNS
jgi:hypothetical protein